MVDSVYLTLLKLFAGMRAAPCAGSVLVTTSRDSRRRAAGQIKGTVDNVELKFHLPKPHWEGVTNVFSEALEEMGQKNECKLTQVMVEIWTESQISIFTNTDSRIVY